MDTYFDIQGQALFAADTTYKYFIYPVKNEIQMRSASYISQEDRNNKGDQITKIQSEILNITSINCYRTSNICIVSGNGMIEAYKLSTLGISKLNTYKFKEPNFSKIQFGRVTVIPTSKYFLAADIASYGLMRWNLDITGSYASILYLEVPQYLSATDVLRSGRAHV